MRTYTKQELKNLPKEELIDVIDSLSFDEDGEFGDDQNAINLKELAKEDSDFRAMLQNYVEQEMEETSGE